MLKKDRFISYASEVEAGFKLLNSYTDGLKILVALFSLGLILPVSYLYMAMSEYGLFSEFNFQNTVNFFFSNEYYINIGYSVGISLFLAAFFLQLHYFLLSRNMKKYLKNHHDVIFSKHQSIFSDHSIESLESFRTERRLYVLISTLREQLKYMKFIIRNYENFDETSFVDDVESNPSISAD